MERQFFETPLASKSIASAAKKLKSHADGRHKGVCPQSGEERDGFTFVLSKVAEN
jgi:hypothetical protein